MTAQPARPDDGPPLPGPVEALVEVAAARFADLGYLAPGGLLDLPLALGGVRALRVRLPAGRSLQLQSIGIDARTAEDIGGLASVRVGGSGALSAADTARLLDIDRPTGTVVDTGGERVSVDIDLARPVALSRLRVRNVDGEGAREARGLRISARTRWRSRTVYDGNARLRAWRRLVERAKAGARRDEDAVALLDVLDLTVRGEYARAHRRLASKVADEEHRRAFRAAVNRRLLPSRGLEWTVHGPQRPFRSWSEEERADYVRESVLVVEALGSLTPNVCFGFGSVLSVVRDHALIPHDDDLDIIVGFEPEEAATLADALRRVEDHLRPQGYEVSGPFHAHRHVRRPGRKRVDVFVGIFEGDSISWYPGARGDLTRDIVFPAGSADMLGVPCPIPARPEAYLERLYGPGWRVPDPYFRHRWDISAYADIAGMPGGAGTAAAPEEPGAS